MGFSGEEGINVDQKRMQKNWTGRRCRLEITESPACNIVSSGFVSMYLQLYNYPNMPPLELPDFSKNVRSMNNVVAISKARTSALASAGNTQVKLSASVYIS